ncbi:MAG: hypothetical protein IKO39_05645 [Treponema sp.]|nr:hypothetical protein [Treponema sp.]
MKNENMTWNTARRIVLVILGIFSLFMLGACSDGSGEGGSSRPLVTRYTYNLTSNATYYRVNEFHCYDNEDNTYDVVSLSIHCFSKTNDSYKNRTGQELIDMVRTNSVTSSSTIEKTSTEASTSTATNSSTNITLTYNIPAGMNYTIYYYF